jgi:hypothetical protein
MKKHFAIAVKAGKFQAQTVTYNAAGKATVKPLSGWVRYADALSFAPAGYKTAAFRSERTQ